MLLCSQGDNRYECSKSIVIQLDKSRHELYRVVPLDTPYSVLFDPSRACNFRCKFCAIHHPRNKHNEGEVLRYEDFTKVIDDMKGFPNKIKKIALCAFGEPLMNKRLPDMVRYIKDAGVAEYVSTITNGSLLTHEVADALVAAGLDEIKFSIEGVDAAKYEELCGAHINWDEFVDNIRYLYEHRGNTFVYVKTLDAAVPTEQDKKKFFDTFNDIACSVFIEHLTDGWAGFTEINEYFDMQNTYGKMGQLGQEVKTNVDICHLPFYQSVIEANGNVGACCSDWEQKIVYGNAFKENFCDIWNGAKHNGFLRNMIKNGRKAARPDVCAVCQNPLTNAKDNMDSHREELLAAFA